MDLSQALVNFVQNTVQPFWHLIFALGACLGMWYVLSVGFRLARSHYYQGQQPVGAGEVLLALVFGAVLVNYSNALNHVSASLGMGAISYSALDYPEAQSFGQLAPAINAVLTLASMAGGAFALKGIYLIAQANTGGGAYASHDVGWKGATHVLAGAALANVVQVIEMLRSSTGGLW